MPVVRPVQAGARRRPAVRAAAVFAAALFAATLPAAGGEEAGGPDKVHPSLRARLAEAAGPVKTWIFFTDKTAPAGATRQAALAALEAGYGAKAIARRRLRRTAPGLFDVRDLPVPERYLDGVREAGARIHVTSRWLNAVSAWVTPGQIDVLSTLPYVHSLEPVRGGRRIEPSAPGIVEEAGGPAPAAPTGGFYGLSEEQLTQINLVALHDAGATGQGVVVGILDTGFKRNHVAFNHPDHPVQVVAEWDFINDDGNTSIDDGDPDTQHSHGTYILGTLGAYAPGALVGGAYDASFILCKTEDITGETPVEEDNYVAGLEFIEMNGGDMATSSLGYIAWYNQSDLDGLTAVTTVAVNIATANGMHCCTAAGNGGHDDDPGTSSLLAPSDAFQVIACGAVNSEGEIAGFSADGPSADGRVKPEVMARGVDTQTVTSMSNENYTGLNGTSLSTPLVACAVACIVQAQPSWTVDQLRQFLFATADYFGSTSPDPEFVYGYGILNAYAAVALDCNGNGVPDPDDITGGASLDVNGNGIPDECECLADVDGNGDIGFTDLLAVLSMWGPCAACPEDVDGNGDVGFTDLLSILSEWGACE